MTQNDEAWANYLKQKKLVLDGTCYRIKAQELKQVTGREPRLLTRFNSPQQVPAPLRQYSYVILPVRNGEYLLFKGNIFYSLRSAFSPEAPVAFEPQLPFPLRTAGRGTGEMQYLDYAFNMGLLHHFLELQGRELYLTIRGREYTKRFEFKIANQDVVVDSVQIEVDGGYEGEREIILCEAKIGHPSHLNIRQIYYPMRHFAALVPAKKVRSLFFVYDLTSLTYTFCEFAFETPLCFESLVVKKYQTYTIDRPPTRTIDEFIDTRFETSCALVPQADDFNKVIELVNAVDEGLNTPRSIAQHFDFAERQAYYYSEAAEFLGLVAREQGELRLTDFGIAVISAPPVEQRDLIAKMVLNSWLFSELIHLARRRGYFDREDIKDLITSVMKEGRPRYTRSTVPRRLQTVESWLRWIAKQIGCLAYEDGRYYLK